MATVNEPLKMRGRKRVRLPVSSFASRVARCRMAICAAFVMERKSVLDVPAGTGLGMFCVARVDISRARMKKEHKI